MEEKNLVYLITGFLYQTLSESEQHELEEWTVESDANLMLFQKVTDIKNINRALEQFKGFVPDRAIENIKQRIHSTFF